MFDSIKKPERLVAALLAMTLIAPLAGCMSSQKAPEETASWTPKSRQIYTELGAPAKLESTCVKMTAGEIKYIVKSFNSASLVVLNEVLVISPAAKCEKVAQVVKYLPRITDYLGQHPDYTARTAILNAAFSG